MQKKYAPDVAIYLVYIREAHPTDGWQVPANTKDEILFTQPTTIGERTEVAQTMCTQLKLTIPCLLDGLDNKVGLDYSAWPDRMYLVGKDGKIVYKGEHGPQGFKPPELIAALDKYLATISTTLPPKD